MPGVRVNQVSSIVLQIVFKVCPVDINSQVLGVPSVERLGDLKSQVWLVQDCFHFLLILIRQSLLLEDRVVHVLLNGPICLIEVDGFVRMHQLPLIDKEKRTSDSFPLVHFGLHSSPEQITDWYVEYYVVLEGLLLQT